MEKRYQVFVSSTFTDLKEERRIVSDAILENGHFPAQMEQFPAADEEQWEHIRKIIDDCDYYIVIIGGRYGSEASDGISFTEREYDYAVSKGIRVIGLPHGRPGDLSADRTDKTIDAQRKLAAFRAKLGTGRLTREWKDKHELTGLVWQALQYAIKNFPATGWVRSSGTETISTDSSEILAKAFTALKAAYATQVDQLASNEIELHELSIELGILKANLEDEEKSHNQTKKQRENADMNAVQLAERARSLEQKKDALDKILISREREVNDLARELFQTREIKKNVSRALGVLANNLVEAGHVLSTDGGSGEAISQLFVKLNVKT